MSQGLDHDSTDAGAGATAASDEIGRRGPFVLAVSAEMVFTDLPIGERLRRIHAKGLQAEIWDWSRHELADLESARADGVVLSSMTGYLRGTLADADGAAELLATAAESIEVARRLQVPKLNLHGTGLDSRGLPVQPCDVATGPMWATAVDTLRRLADLAEQHDVTFVLENLNTAVDHPGVPFATAADCLALVQQADSPRVRLMLDLYHAQIGEGNLIELCRRALDWIGEIQVADVPGRCEPGTGEIAYPAVARALADMGYRGTVGLEAFASGDSDAAIDAFVAAFSL